MCKLMHIAETSTQEISSNVIASVHHRLETTAVLSNCLQKLRHFWKKSNHSNQVLTCKKPKPPTPDKDMWFNVVG